MTKAVIRMKIRNGMFYNMVLLWVFSLVILVNATTYYVTTSGNDSHNGLTEATAWKTIKYAASQAAAGDTVYIKAGIYSEYDIRFSSGSSGNPIIVEGYKNTPGDITNIDWWDFHTNRSLDSTKMPLLDGGDRSNKEGIFLIGKSNIKIKNLQITNYETGIYGYNVTNCHFENIILLSFGKPSSDAQVYSGMGINLTNGYDNVLRKCIAANAGAGGVFLENANNSLVEECEVYCDEGLSVSEGGSPDSVSLAADYYLHTNGKDNIVRNCYVERVGNLDDGGHGIGIHENGENNLFVNCIAKGIGGQAFYVRYSTVKNNEFRNCTAIDGTGIWVREGAHHNTFNCCRTVNSTGVTFYWSGEDVYEAGHDNYFYNCLFEDSDYHISFYGGGKDAKALNNKFVNCVFDGGDYLFRTGRENEGNEMINCIVSNVTNYKYTAYSNYRYVHFKFNTTDFWGNDFDVPYNDNSVYENILQVDPRFAGRGEEKYSLKNNSQLIDAGVEDMSAYNMPELDYYGNPRFFDSKENGKAIIDLGIYECPVLTGLEEQKIDFPISYDLAQNYPNPFNPSTTIRFVLPSKDNVQLSVYNLLGQQVAELVSAVLPAGEHSVKFNAADLPSGLYIYRISAGSYSAVQKMMLIK